MDDAKSISNAPAAAPVRLMLQPSGPSIELTCSGMVLGRHSEADVRLPLPDVSRRHCRFVFVENTWHIEDLGSLNGIFVNGQRVQEAQLNDADTISIGGFVFQVQFDRSTIAPVPTEDHPVLPMPEVTSPQRKAS